MDYQQGRKDAGAQPAGGFGTASTGAGGFGQPAQQPAPGGFGATTSAFGAKPGGLFGGAATTTPSTGFGTTSGGFGSTTNTGGGLFGSQPNAQQTSSPFGAQNTATTGGGLFGNTQQQQPAQNTGGGLFGSSSPFGANTQQQQQQQPGTSTFSFGAPKPPTTGFGATTGTTGFGSTPAAGTSTFGQTNTGTAGGFSFGQNNQQQQQPQPQQQQQPAAGGLFGGGGFGAATTQPAQPAGGLFGQTNTQTTQPATGGLFGSTAPKPAGGLFGSTGTTTTGTGGGFSFGQTNTTQPAAGTTGGLFGNNTATNTGATTGGLFGQPAQQPAQPAAGGGLFGSTASTTGGGLFGAKPATPAGGGLFGAQPAQPAPAAGGSLFGNTNTGTTGGLFGSTNTAQNQQNQPKPGGLFGGGSSLFGQQPQQPAQPAGGLFGSTTQPSGGLFGQQQQPAQQPAGGLFGSFGQSTNIQPQQPTLTASVDQNPYGQNSLFQYSGQKLDLSSSIVKKPAMPPLTSSSFRATPSKSQLNKLRGFSSPLTSSQSPRAGSPLNTLSPSVRGSTIGSPSADRYRGLSDVALSPHAFAPRPSVKKLAVHPKSHAGEDKLDSVLGKSALKSSTSSSQNGSPAQAQRAAASPATLVFNPPRSQAETPVRRSVPLDRSIAGRERQLEHGEYWCKPGLERLKFMSQDELRAVSNFTAGRKDYGEVTFLRPVDLTGIDLDDFLGVVLVFGESELSVYPEPVPKAPEGTGLNVPAKVSLENCFARDKGTKRPITDKSDVRFTKFLKRLKTIPDTAFVSYNESGTWVFEVEHFSRYGLPLDSDDDDEEENDDVDIDHDDEEDRSRSGSSEDQDDDDDFMPPTRGLHDESGSERSHSESGSNGPTDASSVASERSESSPEAEKWALPDTLGIGAEGLDRLRKMQSGFFGQPEKHTGVIDRNQEKLAIERVKRSFQEKGFEFAEEEEVTFDDRAVKVSNARSSVWSSTDDSVPLSATKLKARRC